METVYVNNIKIKGEGRCRNTARQRDKIFGLGNLIYIFSHSPILEEECHSGSGHRGKASRGGYRLHYKWTEKIFPCYFQLDPHMA